MIVISDTFSLSRITDPGVRALIERRVDAVELRLMREARGLLECLEPALDLQRHQLAALLEKVVVVGDHAVEHRFGQTAHL